MSSYTLKHDDIHCIGCRACEVHCKTNKGLLDAGPSPCKIIAVGPQKNADIPLTRFVFMPCFHCEDAGCVRVCPTGAMRRRSSDGIVYIESALCIGCKSCIAACPWGTPQWNSATGKVVKCDYCKDRIDVGLKPACVTKCVTGCLSFGEANALPDPRRERFARQIASDTPCL
jgi:Fe-S-cluster-containing dehydrogenase component